MVDAKRKTPGIVIEQIRAAILDGLYTPGERLMEADVAAQFKVSRSPVREALQALESESTLLATPYSGALVRPLSSAEFNEIAETEWCAPSSAARAPYHPQSARLCPPCPGPGRHI
jgi:DNA-binding GntR family transcriptional regulator